MGRALESVFTLRGHKAGVTALSQLVKPHVAYLISGDEEGTIVIWDLRTFRQIINLDRICQSRVQSLKVIHLNLKQNLCDILVAQSRDNGIHLLEFDTKSQIVRLLRTLSSQESLFSRGDAKSISRNQAILAYPSEISSHLVTIRYVGDEAETLLAGTAKRDKYDAQNESNIFDIIIREHLILGHYLVYVAYEDGCICKYAYNFESIEKVPALNCTGLKIDLIQKYNFNIKDFISAFDVFDDETSSTIIVGSPSSELIFFDSSTSGLDAESNVKKVPLKRRGVSAIASNQAFTIVACWDNTVKIFSTPDGEYITTLRDNTKQVHDILFVETTYAVLDESNADNRNQNSKSHTFCCASMEGNISITTIY